jgi:hypothetical protein
MRRSVRHGGPTLPVMRVRSRAPQAAPLPNLSVAQCEKAMITIDTDDDEQQHRQSILPYFHSS